MNAWKTADVELRVRTREGGWDRWTAVCVAVGALAGWGAGEDMGRWDAYAGVREEPTVLGLTVIQITNLGLDIPADAR